MPVRGFFITVLNATPIARLTHLLQQRLETRLREMVIMPYGSLTVPASASPLLPGNAHPGHPVRTIRFPKSFPAVALPGVQKPFPTIRS